MSTEKIAYDAERIVKKMIDGGCQLTPELAGIIWSQGRVSQAHECDGDVRMYDVLRLEKFVEDNKNLLTPLKSWNDCAAELIAQGFKHVENSTFSLGDARTRKKKLVGNIAMVTPNNFMPFAVVPPPENCDDPGVFGYSILWPNGYPKSSKSEEAI